MMSQRKQLLRACLFIVLLQIVIRAECAADLNVVSSVERGDDFMGAQQNESLVRQSLIEAGDALLSALSSNRGAHHVFLSLAARRLPADENVGFSEAGYWQMCDYIWFFSQLVSESIELLSNAITGGARPWEMGYTSLRELGKEVFANESDEAMGSLPTCRLREFGIVWSLRIGEVPCFLAEDEAWSDGEKQDWRESNLSAAASELSALFETELTLLGLLLEIECRRISDTAADHKPEEQVEQVVRFLAQTRDIVRDSTDVVNQTIRGGPLPWERRGEDGPIDLAMKEFFAKIAAEGRPRREFPVCSSDISISVPDPFQPDFHESEEGALLRRQFEESIQELRLERERAAGGLPEVEGE